MSSISHPRIGLVAAGFALAILLFVYSVYSQDEFQVGYVVITADEGSRVPVATALFSYTNSEGVLVSEAGILFAGFASE